MEYEFPSSTKLVCDTFEDESPPLQFLGLPQEFWDTIYGQILSRIIKILTQSSIFGFALVSGVFLIVSIFHAMVNEHLDYLKLLLVGSIGYIILWILCWIFFWIYNYFVPAELPVKIEHNEHLSTYVHSKIDNITKKHDNMKSIQKDYEVSLNEIRQTVIDHPCPVKKSDLEKMKIPKSTPRITKRIEDPAEIERQKVKWDYFGRRRREYLEVCTNYHEALSNGEDVKPPFIGDAYKPRLRYPRIGKMMHMEKEMELEY